MLAEPVATAARLREGDACAAVLGSPHAVRLSSPTSPKGASDRARMVRTPTVFGHGPEAAPRECNFRSEGTLRPGGRDR